MPYVPVPYVIMETGLSNETKEMDGSDGRLSEFKWRIIMGLKNPNFNKMIFIRLQKII